MELQFTKLVETVLNEAPDYSAYDKRGLFTRSYASYARSKEYDPHGIGGSAVQRAGWSGDLPTDPLGYIVVKWRENDKDFVPLRNPETKRPLTYRFSKAKAKIQQMKDSGKYFQVYFHELPENQQR